MAPLLDTVRRWWFEADSWRDPVARREYQARVSRYLTGGPPPPAQRVTRAQVRERYGRLTFALDVAGLGRGRGVA